jgi:hypothetical protein
MKDRPVDNNDKEPLDELGPGLRRVVERIVRESPPEGLTERILSGLRRQETVRPQDRQQFIEPSWNRRGVRWNFAGAAAIAVTACVLVLLAVSVFTRREPTAPVAQPTQAASTQDLPTALAYHNAMAQSPEALDAMLTRHARQVLRSEPNVDLPHAFPYLLRQMP